MSQLLIEKGKLLLGYSWLRSYVPQNTINSIAQRHKKGVYYINNKPYLNYDETPSETQKKLPAKELLVASLRSDEHDEVIEDLSKLLLLAKEKHFIKYRNDYKQYVNLSQEQLIQTAQQHSIWESIIKLTVEENFRDTAKLFEAYNKVCPGQYKSYNSFANAKSKAIKKGAGFMALDKRLFSSPNNVKRITELQQYWVTGILSIGKKYSNRKVWEMVCDLCIAAGKNPPSKSWVDKYRKKLLKGNINIFTSRYGNEKSFASKQPYASIQHAEYANDQWQMDGWTLPFWSEKYTRHTIVIIRDAYSKKIVGSATGESENTIHIMAALRDAIIKTGSLPYEILTDNHSFNQTKEAEYFKKEIDAIGAKFTITQNPQHKSIIERYNKQLDGFCKDYTGYIGEGIKSRNVDARPKQELLDEYGKNQLSEREIQLIALQIVDKSNNTPLSKSSKTPNQLFEESDKPNSFAVSLSDRLKILSPTTEAKVNRGQVTIKRGSTKYEYQLPAELYSQYNDETVIVRYEDLNEEIYLFDRNNDQYIIDLKQKPKIHGALANQTDEDIDRLNKNKGRLTGIKTQAKKSNEELTRKALEQNPEAYEYLNRITTPKNILKEFEQSSHLKRMAQEQGISLENIYVPDRASEMDNTSLMPVSLKSKNPFTAHNHIVKKYDASEDLDNDL